MKSSVSGFKLPPEDFLQLMEKVRPQAGPQKSHRVDLERLVYSDLLEFAISYLERTKGEAGKAEKSQ
jgi:hypothetical protein